MAAQGMNIETGVAHSGAGESERSMFVHLLSGKVETVPVVTHVHLSDSELVLLDGDRVVAVYRRSDVYFTSRGSDAGPCLC